MVPRFGSSDHCTWLLPLPFTLATNFLDCDANNSTAAGLIETKMGTTAKLTVIDLAGSAALVAVIRTVCSLISDAGAVYTPSGDRLPTPANDHCTARFVLPLTVAEKF